MNLLHFLEKKKGEEITKAGTGTRHLLPSGGSTTRGAAGTSSSSSGTVTVGPCGAGTSSSSDGGATDSDCDSETSSSTMCMRFMLGTSCSSYITCVTNWSGETFFSWRRILILQTRPWLGFRRGAGGQVQVRMNERAVAMGMRHIIWIVVTGNPSGNRHITSSAHFYCDPHKQRT
jgi:hypothetical protein